MKCIRKVKTTDGLNVAFGKNARPITSILKTKLFDNLDENIFPNSQVLDIYAGSGILGIEALVRGAGKVTFVDNDEVAIKLIDNHCKKHNYNYSTVKIDALTFLKKNKNISFDVIFLDPPYKLSSEIQLSLEIILKKIATATLIIIKHHPKYSLKFVEKFLVKRISSGNSTISILSLNR